MGTSPPRCFACAISVLVCFFGLLVIVSWYAHWQIILQLVPDTAPMQYNTALCFVFSSVALFLATTPYRKIVFLLGSAVGLLTSLTLLEYLTGWDLKIDRMFFDPYFQTATAYPGRMSPLAAASFVFMGIGLVSLSTHWKWPRQLAVAGLSASVVLVIALVALAGFIFGIESAYGWGAYSSMALNTAMLFLLLSAGMLVLTWEMGRQNNFDFLRWLPITGSVTLMAMVAFIAIGDMKGLKSATYWRKHTIQVIFTAQTLENQLVDLQRGMRGFVTLGDIESLAAFESTSNLIAGKLDELGKQTGDNPAQQHRLKRFTSILKNLQSYDDQVIELYRQQGPEAVFKMDALGEGRRLFGAANDTLKEFVETEKKLLDLRDVSEETGYRNTERLLIVGCFMAALLLLLANYMASRELTKRQRAEAKLARQAEALRRSNFELQQFAYVASHDMREPLRTISGFAQILKEDYKDKLDGAAQETIGRIVDGANRLALIIDDLLVLSSISSQKKKHEKIGLEKPLQLALENLSVAIRERNAVVQHEPLPTLLMDHSQLVLLFQNLIGNAIKFCRDRAPEIRVNAIQEPSGDWVISIRDNGIGIDPKYFDKIFGIFQRLHSRTAYPGTGIGLAICKKIIERHGGRIWLESTPGVGTTFYFSLRELKENYDAE